MECGITVYPARSVGGRWRAVWHESDERQQCEAATEEKLALKLETVKIRLEADAPNMKKPGAALIAHYLDPDRPCAAPGCAGDSRLGPPQLWIRSSRSVCSYTRSWASWSRDFLDDFLSSAEL